MMVTRADAEANLLSLDALAAQWARAIDATLSRAEERRVTAGGQFVAEIRGSVQTAFARTLESVVTAVPRVLAALFVLALFWLIATVIRRLLRAVLPRVVRDRTVEHLLRQTAYYAIWVLGLVIAVDSLGFSPETVVAGLGLTGLALGFALKDIISNFVSGLLILAIRPFQIGDQIIVGETEGGVERIRLRATEIRTYGGRLVLVPNAELFTSRITNNTASPVRRARAQLFLGYETDLKRASEVARDAAAQIKGVLAEPPVTIRVGELGETDLVLEVRFWTDSRRSDFVTTRSAVRVAVVEAFQSAGIRLPDPAAGLLKTGELPVKARIISHPGTAGWKREGGASHYAWSSCDARGWRAVRPHPLEREIQRSSGEGMSAQLSICSDGARTATTSSVASTKNRAAKTALPGITPIAARRTSSPILSAGAGCTSSLSSHAMSPTANR